MKKFQCSCGQRVFFDNLHCTHCWKSLGFDPATLDLMTLTFGTGRDLVAPSGDVYRLCKNYHDYHACNWLVPADSSDAYCLSCRRNSLIPNLSTERNLILWQRLEQAKRRLLYTLLSLGLPLDPTDRLPGMSFRFLEDQRTNPLVEEAFVTTGHRDGTITMNVAEADDSLRHAVKEDMFERYRTLLGHFRHESGHYYFQFAVGDDQATFRALFGDETSDYQAALKRYYDRPGPPPGWETSFISQYASAHPLEDWAESWAHYLHIEETLETAFACQLVRLADGAGSHGWLDAWRDLSVSMNELNRSMGTDDPYPFVLSPETIEKLEFIRRRVGQVSTRSPASVGY